VPVDFNLHRNLSDVELTWEQRRGEEILSSREVVWWWRSSVVAKWSSRRGPMMIYIETTGVRCARSGVGVTPQLFNLD
jgi:hypothetical protein